MAIAWNHPPSRSCILATVQMLRMSRRLDDKELQKKYKTSRTKLAGLDIDTNIYVVFGTMAACWTLLLLGLS